MKKNILLGLVAVLVFTSGCSTKGQKLTCAIDSDSNGTKISQKYVILYSKDTVTKIEASKSYSFDDDSTFELFKNVIENTNTSMKALENKNIKFDSTTKGNTYKTNLEVNLAKASKKEINNLGFDKDYAKFKSTLEEQGLTCK